MSSGGNFTFVGPATYGAGGNGGGGVHSTTFDIEELPVGTGFVNRPIWEVPGPDPITIQKVTAILFPGGVAPGELSLGIVLVNSGTAMDVAREDDVPGSGGGFVIIVIPLVNAGMTIGQRIFLTVNVAADPADMPRFYLQIDWQ